MPLHTRWSLLLGGLLGCQPMRPKSDSGALHFTSADPSITGMRIECAPTAGSWTVGVRADAWVGTARLWVGSSPSALEQHALGVDASSPQASWDCWSSTIDMAVSVDNPGTGTRYRCPQRTALHMLLAVTEERSERWTDCRRWGPTESIWEDTEGTPRCTSVLEAVLTSDAMVFETGDIAACD